MARHWIDCDHCRNRDDKSLCDGCRRASEELAAHMDRGMSHIDAFVAMLDERLRMRGAKVNVA